MAWLPGRAICTASTELGEPELIAPINRRTKFVRQTAPRFAAGPGPGPQSTFNCSALTSSAFLLAAWRALCVMAGSLALGRTPFIANRHEV